MKIRNKDKKTILEIEDLGEINKHLLVSPGTSTSPVCIGVNTANENASIQITTQGNGSLIVASEGNKKDDVGSIKLAEGANGTNYVGIKSPGKVEKSVVFTLPNRFGNDKEYLTIDAKGNFVFKDLTEIKLDNTDKPKEKPDLSLYQEKHGYLSFLELINEDERIINSDISLGLDFILQLQTYICSDQKNVKQFRSGISVESFLNSLLLNNIQSFLGLQYNPTEGIHGIRYSELIPIIVKSLQEINCKIESNKALSQLSTKVVEAIKEQLEQAKKQNQDQLSLYITIKQLSERITQLEEKLNKLNKPSVEYIQKQSKNNWFLSLLTKIKSIFHM